MSTVPSAADGSVREVIGKEEASAPSERGAPRDDSAQAAAGRSAIVRVPRSNKAHRSIGLRRIAEYELLDSLGHGAMGQVFRAHDTLLDRPVAIKVIAATQPTPMAQERFLIEARAIARLQHPNVVAVYRIGKYYGRLYIVSELVTGKSLDRLEIPMPWPQALDIAIGIVRGLDAAHQNGVLHRDIKPANVMLGTGGQVKLLDFGLAKLSEELGHRSTARGDTLHQLFRDGQTDLPMPEQSEHSEHSSDSALAPTVEQPPVLATKQTPPDQSALTLAGSILGTPGYMAPEVWLGQMATARSDIYSLGALVFELLTGQLPHDREDLDELGLEVTQKEAPLLSGLVPEVPARFAALVQSCLSRASTARPESVARIGAELETIRVEYQEARMRALRRSQRFKRRLVAVLLSSLTLASLLALGSQVLVQRQHAREQERSGTAPSVSRRSIALLPPASADRSASTAAAARVFMELLGSELSVGASLRRLPSETVVPMQIGMKLADALEYPLPVLANIRRAVGADLIAAGYYQVLASGNGSMTVRIQDTRTGARVASCTVSGQPSQLFDLISDAGRELRRQLGIGMLSTQESSQILAARPATPKTAQLYALGLHKLEHFDAAGARESLEALVSQEPDFPLGHAALADALLALGYEQMARVHLRRAVDLSHHLAPEQRFLIEARYYLTTRDWERAFASYRALRSAFPDSLDYGLGLAEAQLTASQPADALATAQSLRGLSDQARQNPRIDLLEGRALVDMGQSQRAIQLLQRAATQARQDGSELIEARAHLEAAYAFGFAGEHTQATQAAERAASLYYRFGEQGRYAESLIAIAGIQMHQGALEGALRVAQSAFNTLMEIKNTSLIADHLGNLSMLLARRGQLPEGLSRAESGYLLAREVERTESVGGNLVYTGWILMLQGHLDRADKVLTQAQQILAQLGNVRMQGWVHWHLGNLRLAQGRLDEARREHAMGLRIRKENGLQGFAAESELALAALCVETGQHAQAEEHARTAIAQFESAGQRDLEAQAQMALAKALLAQNKQGLSTGARDRARAINQQSQDLISKLMVSRSLIEVLLLEQSTLDRSLAVRQIDALLAEATRSGLTLEEMELRLLRLRVETDGPEYHQEVSALIARAKQLGLVLIAEKATRLLPS